jgi:hypothetical protein
MSNDVINISSVVSSRDYRPFVQLKWGDEGCQMTPDEAREHAYSILSAAEAAESDAIFVTFLNEKIGLKEGADISLLLLDLRKFRERTKHIVKDGQHKL